MDMGSVKHGTDYAVVVTWLTSLAGWMQPIVSLVVGVLTAVWLGLRIFESDTVKCWRERRRALKACIDKKLEHKKKDDQ